MDAAGDRKDEAKGEDAVEEEVTNLVPRISVLLLNCSAKPCLVPLLNNQTYLFNLR